MKRSIIILLSLVAYFTFSATSCEEPEGFTQISGVESSIYDKIKAHREDNGLTDAFVHQYIMVKEAQLYSAKMAYTTTAVDLSGIEPHWDIIHDKIGGYNDHAFVKASSLPTITEMFAEWTSDSVTNNLLLDDYTQCGVGVAYDTANVAYITVMLMKVD